MKILKKYISSKINTFLNLCFLIINFIIMIFEKQKNQIYVIKILIRKI